jgi:hypothetical protein
MVEYLQSSVGIIHKNHAESITTFIKESVDEELKDLNSDARPKPKKRLTFCVEGNISVGKTTFLKRIVSDTIELRDLVEVVPEPIDKWQDVGPDHFNILDAFYADPSRYAYTFQNYVCDKGYAGKRIIWWAEATQVDGKKCLQRQNGKHPLNHGFKVDK